MNVTESFRGRLHKIKKKLQYRNAKIRLDRHVKKTPSLSAVPVNHLPFSLREDFNYNNYTNAILKSANNIQHDLAELNSNNCPCSCHRNPSPQTPFFHGIECSKICGYNNNEYENYLIDRIHTLNT